MDLILIIDIDNFGLENKTENIYLMVEQILLKLNDRDRISIILTDNEAKRICPLTTASKRNISRILN